MAEKQIICAIRIRGKVGLNVDFEENLGRLRLRRKYACSLVYPTKENLGMIKKARDFIAFGNINKETLEKLIEKRGHAADKKKKLDVKKVVDGILKQEKIVDLNLKPFFRLHPPRGGIKSKLHYPRGILGDNKEDINKLVERML